MNSVEINQFTLLYSMVNDKEGKEKMNEFIENELSKLINEKARLELKIAYYKDLLKNVRNKEVQ